MDELKLAATAYSNLLNKEYSIEFSNKQTVRFVFKAGNFFHLAGLNHLTDLDITYQPIRATKIYKRILNGEITWNYLTCSRFFDSDARARVSCISRIPEVLMPGGLAVFGFDKNICRAHVKFHSDILFYKDDNHDFFITLGIAQDSVGPYHYPETLFYRFGSEYIRNQTKVVITDVQEILT